MNVVGYLLYNHGVDSYSGFSLVEHLVERALRFTYGYHGRELVRLVNKLLSADVGRFSEIFRSVRRQCGLTTQTPSSRDRLGMDSLR